jgi:hypothetical protein
MKTIINPDTGDQISSNITNAEGYEPLGVLDFTELGQARFLYSLEAWFDHYPNARRLWDSLNTNDDIKAICRIREAIDESTPPVSCVLSPNQINTNFRINSGKEVVPTGQVINLVNARTAGHVSLTHKSTWEKTLTDEHLKEVMIVKLDEAVRGLTTLRLESLLRNVDSLNLIGAILTFNDSELESLLRSSQKSQNSLASTLTDIKKVCLSHPILIQSFKQLGFILDDLNRLIPIVPNLDPDLTRLTYLKIKVIQDKIISILKEWYSCIAFPEIALKDLEKTE